MTNRRQVTIRLLIWLLISCAFGFGAPIRAQTPRLVQDVPFDGLPTPDDSASLDIPFSWTIDAPQPAADVLNPEELPAGMTLPPDLLKTSARTDRTVFPTDQPAMIESDADPRVPSPRPATPQSAAARIGMLNNPVTVDRIPASILPDTPLGPRSVSTPPVSMAKNTTSPRANTRQPAVVLAKSDTALLLPETAMLSESDDDGQGLIIQTDSPDRVVSPVDIGRPSAHRQRILFQPAVPVWDPSVGSMLRPSVHLQDDPDAQILPTPGNQIPEIEITPLSADEERILVADNFEPDSVWVPSELGQKFASFRSRRRKPLARLLHGIQRTLQSQAGRDVGVGVERLPFALFEIDASRPSNNFRLRFESARDWEFPDRVEYFWSHVGVKGPSLGGTTTLDPSVDYQDLRLAMEVGGKKFSATTEIPLRFINPTILGNTGGMGDMVVTTKTVMIDGESLRLTQVLRNQMPTGSFKRGLGNGHVSMEPGFVASYKWDDRTLIHNELKLWFPLGAEPGFSGPVLRYGFGYANVLYESDTFAVIPTFELVGWSVLTGQKSVGSDTPQSIDGENIINLYPGVRLVRDGDSELGLFELGISGGTSITERHWYRSVIRLDLRWTF